MFPYLRCVPVVSVLPLVCQLFPYLQAPTCIQLETHADAYVHATLVTGMVHTVHIHMTHVHPLYKHTITVRIITINDLYIDAHIDKALC